MRKQLVKSMNENSLLEIMYLAKDGKISKRSIQVLDVKKETVTAYCLLRRSKRTFRIDHVLAAFPVRAKNLSA